MGTIDDGVRVRLLGPVRFLSPTGEEGSPGTPGEQALLAALALRAGRLVTADQLIEDLYHGAPPASARRVVVNYVHRLRSRIDSGHDGASLIESGDGGYTLRLPADAVDALRFGRLTAQARQSAVGGQQDLALAQLEEALGMWHGAALPGLSGPNAEGQRRILTEQHATALEHHLELLLACGRHDVAIPRILRALETHRYRERLHAFLMTALYRSGRTAEALDAYTSAATLLAEELGIDAGAELRQLHARILAGDPGLLAAAEPASAGEGRAAAPAPDGSRAAPRPAQLPAPPADFTGRYKQIAELTTVLTDRDAHTVVGVTGMGGVGKTSLALHVAHTVADSFPDGQLYADLRGADGEPAEPRDVLGGFLAALGTPPERIPVREADRAALFRSVVGRRSLLIVLDNAHSVAQVQPLLPGGPRCAALITARALTAMPATAMLRLGVLSPREAVALIGRIAGAHRVEEEPGAVADLVAVCGYLPLALRVAAARLAVRPSWSVAALLARVSDEARLMGELRAGDLAVDAVFELSCSQLTPEQERAFMTIAVPHWHEWGAQEAAAVLGLSELDAEDVLESLVDVALLESVAAGRYRFHDLIAAYARGRARATLSERERDLAVRSAVDFMCSSLVTAVVETQPLSQPLTHEIHPRSSAGARVGRGPAAVEWVRANMPAMAALVEQAAATADATAIALSVDILALLPCFEDSIPLATLARAATAIVDTAADRCDQGVYGTAHYSAGVILRHHVAFDRSRGHLLRTVEIFGGGRWPGDSTRRFLAVLFAHSMLADLHHQRGDFTDARAHAGLSVALAETSGDHRLVARRRTVLLGVEATDPARRSELDRVGEECRDLAATLTEADDLKWLITVMMIEGDSHRGAGRHERAVELYTDVVERAAASGHVRIETECLCRLGEVFLEGGDPAAALAHARRAVERATLVQENLIMARGHRLLGSVLRALGTAGRGGGPDGGAGSDVGEEADEQLELAASLFKELGLPGHGV
ncbi:BTAD domain-containing putative transcriptional regulator [Streptomyces sp. NPDC090442]|uniref:AfsR/SARP family transcriptional regulator n=1 Tax=Streptomyces sp. NPDC090442 TaxID=3365962 RepID=UPI00382D765E